MSVDYRGRFIRYDADTDWVEVALDEAAKHRLIGSEAFFPEIANYFERSKAVLQAAEIAVAATVHIKYEGDSSLPFWPGAKADFVTEEWLKNNR